MKLDLALATGTSALLENVLWPTIYCREDVYTIKPIVYSKGTWIDKTSCESFVNHIHLNDYISCDDSDAYKRLAFSIADMWVTKLKTQFPYKHFAIYLMAEDEKWGIKSNITIRFCLLRGDEPVLTENKPDNKTLWVWMT